MLLYEILVPTIRLGRPVHTRHHRVWDQRIREIAGGLTILTPTRGQWLTHDGTLLVERMIPVRIACTRKQMEKIADLTAEHYCQKAIMFYRISDEVEIKHYADNGS